MASESTPQDSLSLEETNKVRISLGLKPIGGEPDPDEPEEEDRDAVAERNFSERVREEKRARAEKEIKDRIEKQKNQRALHAQLKGSTLGDPAKDDIDAKAWARKLKKRAARREAELAARRQKEMEEADTAAYDERDLAGLRVAHDTDELAEGEDVILTLKDARVLGGEEDELQNVQLADLEADAARAERRKRAKAEYTGYDDEEFAEGRVGKKSEILAKYDDGFSAEAARTEGFRLGEAPPPKVVVQEDDEEMGRAPDQKVKLSLDFAQDWEVSDYMREGDKGFKVKKRKVKKGKTRQREVDPEDEQEPMAVEPTFEKRRVDETPDNLVDDDDLQAALARSRRLNNRKKRVRPEDLAERIKAERAAAPEQEEEEAAEDDGRITFDETSEFVRNVSAEGKIARAKSGTPATPAAAASGTPAPAEATPAPEARGAQVVQVERVEGDVDMESDEDEDDELAEMAAREGLSLAEYRLKIDAQMAEIAALPAEAGPDGGVTGEEPRVTQGMAGVLALLRNQGTLEKKDAAAAAQEKQKERLQKQHDLWLADHKRRLAREEMEKLAARGTAMQKDQAQREYENRAREMAEAKAALEEFRHYRPEVELKYHDEFGREMTPKEAWKSLSHRFHGKTSGRMKTEKRMKKIEEERKARAMLAGDTPLGMGAAFAKRQEKTGQAHMVLSVGNKGSVQRKQT